LLHLFTVDLPAKYVSTNTYSSSQIKHTSNIPLKHCQLVMPTQERHRVDTRRHWWQDSDRT